MNNVINVEEKNVELKMTIFQNKPPPHQELNHFITANKKVLKFGKNGMNKK